MKKLLIISTVLVLILSIIKEEKVIIPKEAIRFRVIANSNSNNDQRIKKEVVNNLSPTLQNISKLHKIEETRNYINNNLNKFTEIVDKTLKMNQTNYSYNINYGKNYFPKKTYKEVEYEEGYYDSLVITLGDGLGENFWCVLFPPICMVDKEKNDVEYKSFVKELIEKYF